LIYAFSPEGVACLAAVLATDPLLAFDIDGTLAPIVERPDEARLPDAVQQCLAELARRFDVAVITGRGVDDARRMLSFTPRYLIGNHGIEGWPGAPATRPAEFARAVAAWRDTLAASQPLAAAGVSLEDKRYSLSLHYRRAENPAKAHRAILDAVAGLVPAPRVIPGKAVVNLLPFGAPDKGDAIRALIEKTGCSNVLYVGDDDTDETVFGLNLPSVLTLRVEPAADSAAALFLRDQREVLTLIRHIAARLGVHGGSSASGTLPDAPPQG
jgi:trehalose 6-phosphate phosphatase